MFGSENEFVLGVKLLCRIYHFAEGIKGQFTQQRNFLRCQSMKRFYVRFLSTNKLKASG